MTVSIGSWITLAHPAIAEIMARAGFDWLVVDLEHSVITIREAEELIRVIELSGSKPLVRLTSNHADQIKRVMDAGAHGIIVPMVNSFQAVQDAANAMFYPPYGQRGVGLARAQHYGASFNIYYEKQKSYDLIAQIEHIAAINQLHQIFSHEKLTGFMVGPYDLSASLHIPGQFDHPDFLSALSTIQETANQYPHLKKGVHLVEPNLQKLTTLINNRYDFIAYSVDIRILDVSLRSAIHHCKNLPDKETIK